MKICVEDRAQDLLDSFSEEAAVQDLFVRLSVQGVYKRSPQKIFVRDLKVQLGARSLLSSPGLWSLYKISIRGLLARSLHKISIRALLASFV